MITRRLCLAAPLAYPFAAAAAGRDFDAFVAGVRAEAVRAGLRGATVDEAFRGVQPNPRVIELRHHQPESELSWAQYRRLVLPQSRIDAGRAAYARASARLASVTGTFGADPRVVVGIWGLESGFGARTGNYRIVEALATLAYDGGARGPFFRGELLHALRILDEGDIAAHAMTGSWAGAMGQPQFMPSSYLHYAVDADGDGRRDIWTSQADVFGSIANYLQKSGWHAGQPWLQPVQVPPSLDPGRTGHDAMRPLGDWQAMGVRRADGTRFSRADVRGAVLLPDGAGGEAFMVYPNFNVIRRYNSPDIYALAVGLLGNAVA